SGSSPGRPPGSGRGGRCSSPARPPPRPPGGSPATSGRGWRRGSAGRRRTRRGPPPRRPRRRPRRPARTAQARSAAGPRAGWRRLAGRFGRPPPHTPVAVTAEATAVAEEAGADCVVAIGGGSAIGVAKAVAVRTGIRQVAVPTTYSGSEMTPVLGETEDGVK